MKQLRAQNWLVLVTIYLHEEIDTDRWSDEIQELHEADLVHTDSATLYELCTTQKGTALVHRMWHIQVPTVNIEYEFPNEEFTLREHNNTMTRVV